jgi:hypothetical protein
MDDLILGLPQEDSISKMDNEKLNKFFMIVIGLMRKNDQNTQAEIMLEMMNRTNTFTDQCMKAFHRYVCKHIELQSDPEKAGCVLCGKDPWECPEVIEEVKKLMKEESERQ